MHAMPGGAQPRTTQPPCGSYWGPYGGPSAATLAKVLPSSTATRHSFADVYVSAMVVTGELGLGGAAGAQVEHL